MRLWHKDLIPLLPRQQLLGQHREVAALRGLGWGKKHSVVNYVFTYPFEYLYHYHLLVMAELENRGYRPAAEWYNPIYRGKQLGFTHILTGIEPKDYPEHNQSYLQECLDNLKEKGITLK